MRKISLRLAAIEESATLAITAKAKALRAAGEPVIGFGAGEPDFATPVWSIAFRPSIAGSSAASAG